MTDGKRLLALAFYFPPMTGVGGERILRFLRHLPAHGWRGDVVTIKDSVFFPKDPATLATIPGHVNVRRTRFLKIFLPVSLVAQLLPTYSRARFKNFFAIPDLFVGWLPFLLPALRSIFRGSEACSPYQVLLSTSPPVSSHLAAAWARRRFGIPWVADFRDPWMDNPMFHGLTGLHRRLHANCEAMVMRTADAVIANTRHNAAALVKRYPTYSKKVRVIPNGYDEDEFANLPIRTGSNHRMVLCHAGTLFPTYDPNPLFSALASVLRASPPTRDQLRVRMLGNRSEREAIARWNLTGVVDECPWKPRDVVLEELAACDATILCMSGPRARDFWVPAKTYMYLRLGKPILALVPCGEARAIVERAGVGRICDPNNVIEIADTIHQMFQEWESGRLTASPDWDHIRQFEGTALTSQLSTVLEDLGRWRRVYPVVHH